MRARALAMMAAVVTLLTEGASGRQGSPGTGLPVAFVISAHGVHSSGGELGGGTISRHWRSDGDSGTLRVYTSGRCAMGMDNGGFERDASVIWKFEARLISHDADGAAVDLMSQRQVRDASLGILPMPERHRRLYLFEGRSIPLEYTTIDSGADGDCDGYSISASMYFVDPPEIADARLGYDVWLIYTDRQGNERTQRIASQGEQGRTVDFGFAPLWFDAAGQPNPTGPIGLAVSGNVRGRLLHDGSVHVNFGALRMMRDRNGSGMATGGGTSTDIGLGETIEVQLPPLSESLAPFGSLKPVFKGATVALRVRPYRIV